MRQLASVLASGALDDAQRRSVISGMAALRKSLRYNHPDLDAHGHCDVSAADGADDPTSVYKYFDARRILIYVGITGAGIARNRQHNESKEWWKYVVSQEIEHYKSRRLAHEREVQLIEKYRPPFNKQHNRDYAAARRFYLNMAKDVNAPMARALLDEKHLLSEST